MDNGITETSILSALRAMTPTVSYIESETMPITGDDGDLFAIIIPLDVMGHNKIDVLVFHPENLEGITAVVGEVRLEPVEIAPPSLRQPLQIPLPDWNIPQPEIVPWAHGWIRSDEGE